MSSQYNLDKIEDYQSWRNMKMSQASSSAEHLYAQVSSPSLITEQQKREIYSRLNTDNMAVFEIPESAGSDKSLIHDFGACFGLNALDSNLRADEDSVTSIEVRGQVGNQYIPYTNKPLSWHTDGYYNKLDKQIYGIIMYCVSPAESGGENELMDPELVYIALRDENPSYIEALMHPNAMTIPANIENGQEIRPEQSGPVFMLRPDGRLHMRFSARKRNIVWRDTPETLAAVEMINLLLKESEFSLRVKLKAGQGIICNNVLHNRTRFENSEDQKRLVYRARFYDCARFARS